MMCIYCLIVCTVHYQNNKSVITFCVFCQFLKKKMNNKSTNTGTLKTINFSFETNGKLMVLGVPILKPFRILQN